MKDVLYLFTRDPIDLIIFLLVLGGFIYWVWSKNEKIKNSLPAAFLLLVGYVFYVMYRFAVIYSFMDQYILDEAARKTLGL